MAKCLWEINWKSFPQHFRNFKTDILLEFWSGQLFSHLWQNFQPEKITNDTRASLEITSDEANYSVIITTTCEKFGQRWDYMNVDKKWKRWTREKIVLRFTWSKFIREHTCALFRASTTQILSGISKQHILATNEETPMKHHEVLAAGKEEIPKSMS